MFWLNDFLEKSVGASSSAALGMFNITQPLDNPNENKGNWERIACQLYNERSTELGIEYEEFNAKNKIPLSE
jgi:hypothetical protein